eukprot:Rhum_TRINITY_DN15639_c0_g1::Rhum_TRINITY_DN15639_c0_g1_i1::g.161738::m.161738
MRTFAIAGMLALFVQAGAANQRKALPITEKPEYNPAGVDEEGYIYTAVIRSITSSEELDALKVKEAILQSTFEEVYEEMKEDQPKVSRRNDGREEIRSGRTGSSELEELVFDPETPIGVLQGPVNARGAKGRAWSVFIVESRQKEPLAIEAMPEFLSKKQLKSIQSSKYVTALFFRSKTTADDFSKASAAHGNLDFIREMPAFKIKYFAVDIDQPLGQRVARKLLVPIKSGKIPSLMLFWKEGAEPKRIGNANMESGAFVRIIREVLEPLGIDETKYRLKKASSKKDKEKAAKKAPVKEEDEKAQWDAEVPAEAEAEEETKPQEEEEL